MNDPGAGRDPGEPQRLSTRFWRTRWFQWTGGVVLVLLLLAAAAVTYVVRNAETILRRRVIANLENRFHSPVELDSLHISAAQGLKVTGTGLRILYLAGPTQPDQHPEHAAPMLSVDTFEFRSGLRELFEPTMRVVTVYARGMRINIPPHQQRGTQPPDDPKRRGQSRLGLVVDKIVCTDLVLSVETSKPGKPPLVFDIKNLTLKDVGAKKPLLFEASLVNPKPVGDIHSTGHFGPWQDDNPRDTPIDGSFTFTHADLSTIKGLGGILSGTGDFAGLLGTIGVTGSTDTPDFSIDVSGHPVALHTEFQAEVDGTSGDTTLKAVRATFLHTVLQANGSILRSAPVAGNTPPGFPGQNLPGHDVELTVTSTQARVEDLLLLGAKTSPPLMRGALSVHNHLSILPGPVSVAKKMKLEGTFSIDGATFSNPHFQETVDKLSERAQGHPQEAKAGEVPLVRSRMGGRFTLHDAVLHVPDLKYAMPGAQVELAGDYSLDGQTFAFEGTVRTQAKASEMLTGWKSLLAMPFDKFLEKHGAGVELPIKISGTKSDPKFGVDLDRLGLGFLSHHKDRTESVPGGAAAPPR